MDNVHCCRLCKYGAYVPVKRSVICRYNGVVKKDGICKKYVFDPFKLKVKRERIMDFSKYEEMDFSIE